MIRDRKLPPLGALRGFEACARLGSFTKAAVELHVTQTAISHQVRSLEEFYSQKLFDRHKRDIKLTEAGSKLASLLTDLLDQLDQTSCSLLCPVGAPLRITMPPAFGAFWLVPRLSKFWAEHTVELNLIPCAERLDFRTHNIDIGIRCGDGNWPGMEVVKLMPYNAVPVCAPEYLEKSAVLNTPADLSEHNLIHDSSYQNWGEWFSTHNIEDVDFRQGVICQDPALVYDLALRGQGVALMSAEIVAEKLASGELVAPFGQHMEGELAFYVVFRNGALESTSVKLFHDFLLEEAVLVLNQ